MNPLLQFTIPAPLRRLAQLLLFFAAIAIPAPGQTTWDNRTALIPGSGNTNAGFAYNGSRFLMVTSSPSTYWRSVAGTSNWTFSSFSFPATGVTSLSIAHGAGATLVAGSNNVLMRTTVADPVTASWTSQRPVVRPNASNPGLNRVRFLNNQFVIGTQSYNDTTTVANSYTEAITSADGLTWTSRQFSYSSLGNTTLNLRDAAFRPGVSAGNGTYVFTTGTNTVLVANEALGSASRVTFSANTSDTGFAITHGAGLFVVLTSNGKVFTSATGAQGSWNVLSTPVSTTTWNDVFHDGTAFVVVGGTVTGSTPARPAIIQSTDGITWTEATSVPATSSSLSTVFRGDGLWLAGGGTRTLFTSGSSSVSAPAFTVQPANFNGSVGGTITLTATVSGTPSPTLQWFRNDSTPVALVDDARISGATSNTLTITGTTYADAKGYYLAATNTVGTTNSSIATVALNFTAGGAVLTPYGITNSLGGSLVPGASPARATVPNGGALFVVGTGLDTFANTFINPTSYTRVAGLNPVGTKALLNPSSGSAPPMVYDLSTSTGVVMPVPTLPLGPITAYNAIEGIGLANNGDVTGQFQTSLAVSPFFANYAFHYSAATQVYTLLGNVPNATNDIASNPGGISADGTAISGYERTGVFNGPFLWTTTGGFTLLPQPANGGPVSGDIRAISPNARFIVGFGTVASVFGSGQSAMRWDRGSALGAPVGFALPRRLADTFGDARTVNDDGTVGGTVRQGGFTGERAAVWLPSGALVVLPDYLQSTYSLNTTGFTLTQVTSISADLRTLAGTALLSDNTTVQGWILTLPAPLDAPATPEIVVHQFGIERANNSTITLGTAGIGAPSPVQTSMSIVNLGGASLTGITATVGGPNAGDFIYVPNGGNPGDLLPTSLGINEGVSFALRFAPTAGATGTRTATLTITSDDSDENPFVVNLQGTASTPTTQTITFNQPPDRLTTDGPFVLSATSSAGFPVSFALISGPATLFGTTFTLTGAPGTVTVEARQTGSATVLAATPVSRSFSVIGADPLADFLANAGVPANLRGPNDDADNDGLANLLEYALDLNPNGTGGAFTGTPPTSVQTPTHLNYTYRRVRNDVTYVIETSPTLIGGTWTSVGVTQGTPAGDGTTTASIPVTPGSQFLRLTVSR